MADHPLVQLTLVRFREFVREPEALFWVFVFPILLAAGLGIAFRNRPADVLKIAAVTPQLAAVARARKSCSMSQQLPAAGRRGSAAHRQSGAAGRAGPGRRAWSTATTTPIPKAAPRACWRIAPSSAPPAASDPVPSTDRLMREPGSRYIDFLIPGLLGMNLMGSAIWGMGFAIVDARRKKLMKRLIATPMPRHYYLLSFLLSRLLLLVVEVGVLLGFGVLVFHVPVRGSLRGSGGCCASWARCRSAPSDC